MRPIAFAAREWCSVNSGIPLIPAIFPKPALAAPEPVEPVGQLDAHHIFCVLVAELPFDPQPQRGAVADRKRPVVEAMGKNGLRVESVDQIDAFVILSGAVKRLFQNVGAMEDHEPGGGKKRGPREHDSQRNALPFADRAPPFDAVMAGDLGPLRQVPQIRERQFQRLGDQPIDAQAPSGEIAFPQAAYSSPSGILVPFTLKAGDTSPAVNSRARAWPPPSSR